MKLEHEAEDDRDNNRQDENAGEKQRTVDKDKGGEAEKREE